MSAYTKHIHNMRARAILLFRLGGTVCDRKYKRTYVRVMMRLIPFGLKLTHTPNAMRGAVALPFVSIPGGKPGFAEMLSRAYYMRPALMCRGESRFPPTHEGSEAFQIWTTIQWESADYTPEGVCPFFQWKKTLGTTSTCTPWTTRRESARKQ